MEYRDDKLTETIIECVIKVHKQLGPGFPGEHLPSRFSVGGGLSPAYRKALVIELRAHGLRVETEKEVVITCEGHEVGRHRSDVLVNFATPMADYRRIEMES